jgi:hypothetical protein
MVGVGALIAGAFEPAAWSSLGGFTVQFLAYAQLGPLAQESSAARRQNRPRSALGGWLVFAVAILILAVSQVLLHSLVGHLGQILAVVAAMAATAALYQRRTDFTS